MSLKPENTIIEANEKDETSSINTNLGASFSNTINMKKSFSTKPVTGPTLQKKDSTKRVL